MSGTRAAIVATLLLAGALAGCAERGRLPTVDAEAGAGRIVVDAPAGRTVQLLDDGTVLADAVADADGRAVFVGLPPGDRYRVRLAADGVLGPLSDRLAVGPRAPVVVGNVTAAIVAGAEPDASLLLRRNGTTVRETTADAAGRRVVRNLTAGVDYTAVQTVQGHASPVSQPTSVAPAAVGGPGHVAVAGARPDAGILLLRVDGPAGPDPRRDPTVATGTAGPGGSATFETTDDGDPLVPGPGYYAIQRTADGTTRPSNVVTVS